MTFGPKFKSAISSLFLAAGTAVYFFDQLAVAITFPPIVYKIFLAIGVAVRAWKDLPDINKDGIPDVFQVTASK